MSIKGFFNQSVTLYPQSSRNRYGRLVVGEGSSKNARFKRIGKTKLLPNGEVIMLKALMHVDPSISVSVDDRVDYGDDYYKVFSKTEPVDGQGNVHHIRLELVEWLET